MAKAIIDPSEVRRFAQELKHFNTEVSGRLSSLQGRFKQLGESWQDQEQRKFEEEFESVLKGFKKFMEVSEKQVPTLLRKAERIDEYLRQR